MEEVVATSLAMSVLFVGLGAYGTYLDWRQQDRRRRFDRRMRVAQWKELYGGDSE